MFFATNPAKAILADINGDLINTYRVLKAHPRAVYNRLNSYPKGKTQYYKIRKLIPENLEEVERAARFIYLNRFCFNGLYRTNNDGRFNVPYSSSGTGALPDWNALKNVSKRLVNTKLLDGDFEKLLLKEVKKGDFVYLDPPYAVDNRRIFTQYGPHSFGLNDLQRLKNVIDEIDKRGAKFLLSYAYSKESNFLMENYQSKRLFVQRNIAGFSERRSKWKVN